MFSKIIQKTPDWFSTVLCFTTLAFKDWENFFPLSAHSDLKFQIVGEFLEVLALMGIFALPRLLFPRAAAIPASVSPAKAPPIFIGAFIAAWLFVAFWRDYFPNDTFSFAEALKDVGYSLIVVVVIALFALVPPARNGKPKKEEETSVV